MLRSYHRSKSEGVCASAMNGLHAKYPVFLDDPILPENAVEDRIEEDEESEVFEDDHSYESEEDRSHDREAFGIYQQLPVSNGEPDLTKEPQTAEEYLQRVR